MAINNINIHSDVKLNSTSFGAFADCVVGWSVFLYYHINRIFSEYAKSNSTKKKCHSNDVQRSTNLFCTAHFSCRRWYVFFEIYLPGCDVEKVQIS